MDSVAVTYSLEAINDRLAGVITAIDSAGAGFLILRAGSTVVSTITLATPCGTVNNGVLTFGGTLQDNSAAGSASPVDNAIITNATGGVEISGLTVGVAGATGYDILISNGINSTVISAGQVVAVLGAQITGS